jgi:hypothetical protein
LGIRLGSKKSISAASRIGAVLFKFEKQAYAVESDVV